MRYPAYPKYKPSGVEWIGEVPEHWEVKRLKTTAAYWVSSVDKVPSDDELPVRLCNYTDVYYHDHIRPDMGLMETTATAEEIRRFGLQVGDVLITKDSEEWRDIAIPALVVKTAPDLVCGYHLAIVRCRPRELSGTFLLRAFQSCAINQQFQVAATGVTRYGLPKSAIGEAWLPLPPSDEQCAIANFLDAQTAKLDTLIAKEVALIEKLKEKRTALISRTVTYGLPPDAARAAGLDPHPKLKPSGIDWLGDVPERWEVRRFRHLIARLDQGWSPSADSSPAEDDQWGVLKLSAARDGRFDPSENKALDEVPDGVSLVTPEEGDLLISRANTPERVGDACLVLQDYPRLILPDLLYRVKLLPGMALPAYVCAFLLSRGARAQIEADARGSSGSMVKLGQGHLLSWLVPCPPLSEQCVIAEFLGRELAKVDQMIAKIETAIERLQEYRAALITAAVIGKIDVRNVATDAELAEAVA